MSTHADHPPRVAGRPVLWLASAALAAAAIVAHAALPRYELTTVGVNRESVVVFDRWTGQFQRIDYQPDGEPRATSVVDPF
jgi:hypothetical protein